MANPPGGAEPATPTDTGMDRSTTPSEVAGSPVSARGERVASMGVVEGPVVEVTDWSKADTLDRQE